MFAGRISADRPSSRKGFTLIEVLIAITIMLLVTGGGIAAFVNFNDRQSVQGAARQLQTILRSAQVKARVGEKPGAGCDKLTGYRVQTAANTNQVILSAVCVSNAGAPQMVTHTTSQLQNNVVAEGTYAITFANLYGGVTGATTIVLQKSSVSAYRYSFVVTPGGEISDGAFIP